MKYIAIDGGLGNQMFQYAFLLALRNRGIKARYLLTNVKWEHTAGFELERLFNIPHESRIWEYLYNYLPIPFRKIFNLTHSSFEGKNFKYQSNALNTAHNYSFFYGTWQTELYFTDIRHILLETFKFNENIISNKTNEIKDILDQKGPTISVHVRRGDYQSIGFKTIYRKII